MIINSVKIPIFHRAKTTFHEAISAELQEECYMKSLDIFKYLLLLDGEIYDKDSTIHRLRDSKEDIEKLVGNLKRAEDCVRNHDADGEVAIFFETIEEFSSKDFKWIADEFYKVLIEKYRNFENLERSRLNFRYADFLRKIMGNLEKAAEHYHIAKECFGKFRASIYQLKDLMFYKDIVKNYCGILIELAENSTRKDPKLALGYIQLASVFSDESMSI